MTQDPLDFLFSLERLGMKFGLENMRTMCEALGHPEESFRSVHIAGTNGKGSVTVMVETALRAAGHRTARYTSPHLTRLEERFVIDGQEVRTDALREAAGRVQNAAVSLVSTGALASLPTFFECTTAIAFELFRRAAVEIAVVEVGLGGRLDATNVVTPLAAAITTIDLDHQAQLGDSIAAIAAEKAGIVKPGVPIVCGPLAPEAEQVVRGIAVERGARFVRAGDAVRITGAAHGNVEVRSTHWTFDNVPLALSGHHQRDNATVAVAVLGELARAGIAIPAQAVRAGLTDARWPARLERIDDDGTEFLLDAAHNPAGARALASYLQEIGWTAVTLIFAAMQDKDVGGMLAPLVPLCRSIICTTAPSPRAHPAAALAAMAAEVAAATTRIEIVNDPAAALALARVDGGRIVAAGSIFLIGPLRAILR